MDADQHVLWRRVGHAALQRAVPETFRHASRFVAMDYLLGASCSRMPIVMTGTCCRVMVARVSARQSADIRAQISTVV